ncbi:hypothetical protein NDU88_000054 [Pleurodeles waltl]|uniref:Uncharacterized protein n=1 Tax=Pleurodeles waltl TaxID=8319 RepID=A0AAV7WEB6_PLEWA|nr:hypothetical protein NDU88_000054 [Pleurodeles waltl]
MKAEPEPDASLDPGSSYVSLDPGSSFQWLAQLEPSQSRMSPRLWLELRLARPWLELPVACPARAEPEPDVSLDPGSSFQCLAQLEPSQSWVSG